MPMCQYCSPSFVAYSWLYRTTLVAKAVIPPSCGQYTASESVYKPYIHNILAVTELYHQSNMW